jgi:hypothetical protein
MSPEVEKVKSLQWAIEELSKQKEDLGGKLKIALKREETGSLIDEVNAQKGCVRSENLCIRRWFESFF